MRNFSYGDTAYSSLSPEREAITDYSNDCSQVDLGEPMRFFWGVGWGEVSLTGLCVKGYFQG